MLKSDLRVKKELSRENGTFAVTVNDDRDILKGISALPAVSGYNRTALKDKGRLVASFQKDEPLIADWQYGRGRAVVFTSAFNNEWGKDLVDWSDSGRLLDRMLKWVTPVRAGSERDFRITSDLTQQDTLALSLISRHPLTEAPVFTARYHLEEGEEQTVRFNQVAVDRYQATIHNLQEGFYLITLYKNDLLMDNVPVVIPYSKEWARFTPDTVRLRQIAETTGGMLLPPSAIGADADYGKTAVSPVLMRGNHGVESIITYHGINAYLIILAVLVFLIDLAIIRFLY
ncbi:MAG: hypothetical protein HY762_04300 [Planctomycetes bacterium]|nr:hypothetical protein [Planctomycetota bacterium]